MNLANISLTLKMMIEGGRGVEEVKEVQVLGRRGLGIWCLGSEALPLSPIRQYKTTNDYRFFAILAHSPFVAGLRKLSL